MSFTRLPSGYKSAKLPPPRSSSFEAAYRTRLLGVSKMFQDHVMHEAQKAYARGGDPSAELRAAHDALIKASGVGPWLDRFAGQIDAVHRRYVERILGLPRAHRGRPRRDARTARADARAPRTDPYTAADALRRKAGGASPQTPYFQRVALVQPEAFASQSTIEGFRQENLSLIKNAAQDQIDQIAGVLREGQVAGTRWEDLLPQIQERAGVARSRAKLIARDQTNKFSAGMAELHQTSNGIEEYTWKTAGDMAVRGRPGGIYAKSKDKHWPLEGTKQRWDSPPAIPGTSEHLHPGQDIQCRCQALPIVPFFD